MFNKRCAVCNKVFNAHPSGAEKRKCCSRECVKIWKTKTVTGEANPSWKGGWVEKTCEGCGKIFSVKRSHFDRRHHCSKRCYWASKVSNLIGASNPNWRGGTSFEPYPATFNDEFKRLIRERDNYTCAICKEHGKSVHHINYVKNDTNPKNCITLCYVCHSKTNFNREYWQEYFSKIMPGCF